MNELRQALASTEKDLQKSTMKSLKLEGDVLSLRRSVHRARMGCDRAKETRSRAVENAVARVTKYYESVETKRVKRPDGRIEDWVRDLVVELVALDGVPTARVPQVIERVRQSFTQKKGRDDDEGGDDRDDQTISDRSVRRMMCESYVKAFMYAAKIFEAAPCQCCNNSLIDRMLTY